MLWTLLIHSYGIHRQIKVIYKIVGGRESLEYMSQNILPLETPVIKSFPLF